MGMTSDENASRGASSPNSASPGGRGSTGNTTSGRSTGPSSGRQESGSQSRSGNQTSTSGVSYGGGGRNGSSSGGFSGSNGGSSRGSNSGRSSSGFSGSNGGSNPSGTQSGSRATQDAMNSTRDALNSIGSAISGFFDRMETRTSSTVGSALNALASTIAGTPVTPTTAFAGLTGNVGIVANTLAELGWQPHHIAGIVGRFQQESYDHLDPNATRLNDAGPGLHSVGIGQWNRERLEAGRAYAESIGMDWNDVEAQARFFDHEIRNNPDEARALQALTNAKTEEEAAIGMMHYERPQGYTASNPTAGHGFTNTVDNARGLMSAMSGSQTASADQSPAQAAISEVTSGVQTPAGKSSTATQTASNPLGSFARDLADTIGSELGLGGLAQMAGGFFAGDEAEKSQVGQTVAGAYVDRISTPAGRIARGEPEPGVPQIADTKRQGAARVSQLLDDQKPVKAAIEATRVIRDPVGFVLDTIVDSITNSPRMNNPGPEGEPDPDAPKGLAGFLGNLFDGSADTTDKTGLGGFAYQRGDNKSGKGESKEMASSDDSGSAGSDDFGIKIPQFTLPNLEMIQPLAIDISLPKTTRKPYQWSTIS